MSSTSKPFKGLRVLELASVLAGPAIGMFFAELGAEVIKVENPGTKGDVTRSWKLPTEKADSDISSYFACVNWGKKSVAIDVRSDAGRELVYSLVEKSDIVLASYKPGDAEKLGLDYQTLETKNSKIIYAHVTGYREGDDRAGFDALIQAESGFTYMNGEQGRGGHKMPVALIDLLAAHQLKEAILIALYAREKTGEGDSIKVSLFDSAVSSLANQATNWLVAKHIATPQGSMHPNIVPYGKDFVSKDGQRAVLAVGNDKQFIQLCEALECPELLEREDFKTNLGRVQHQDELYPLLDRQFSKFTLEELQERLNQRKVPFGVINDMQQVFERTQGRDLVLTSENSVSAVRTAVFESKQVGKPEQVSPPPAFASATSEVLRDVLGLEGPKLDALEESGVILVA